MKRGKDACKHTRLHATRQCRHPHIMCERAWRCNWARQQSLGMQCNQGLQVRYQPVDLNNIRGPARKLRSRHPVGEIA